jgi:hypothetical protein
MSLTNNEQFSTICLALNNTGFSANIEYVQIKRKYCKFISKSSNTKHINLNMMLTRSKFKQINNTGDLTGFYHAIW